MASFEERARVTTAWRTSMLQQQHFDAISGFEAMSGVQPPILDALDTPAYKAYPQSWDKVFPWYHVIFFWGISAWNVYDAGKGRFGTPRLSKRWDWVFDAMALLAIVAAALDYLVTINGTYIAYNTLSGLENNSPIRRFVEVMETKLGMNFAQGMLVMELAIVLPYILTSWYYGKREGNLSYLVSNVLVVYQRFFAGFMSWPPGATSLSLAWAQISGQKGRQFQGGGPARAAATY